jgi:hypothetical protein
MLSGKLETVHIHDARAATREKFVAQLFELSGDPHPPGYASVEAGFIAPTLVPKYVLRLT